MSRAFDGRAEVYAEGRPCYSSELIDCLCDVCGLSERSVVADIGSGTGKLSKQFLERGIEVYCVEPNQDMRLAAEKELGACSGFHSIIGNAEATALDAGAADCIVAAQAFHWFDVLAFKRECARIGKSGAKTALIWNVRSCEAALNRDWHDVFSLYCPSFKGFSNGMKLHDPRIAELFAAGYEYVSFEHPLLCDRSAFIKRSLSSSYSLKDSEPSYRQYIAALNELFDRYENNGRVEIPNRSVAYIGDASI